MKHNEIYKMYQDKHPMARDKMIGFTPLAKNNIIVGFSNMKDKVLVTLHEKTNMLTYNILRYDIHKEEPISDIESSIAVIRYRVGESVPRKLAIDALEKQIPKKPSYIGNNFFHCPNGCEYVHTYFADRFYYCPKCGCAIDWSE